MNDQWTDRLSEYVDGELANGERHALEAHLATCAACRATVEDLRNVVARAKSLEHRPPTAELWSGIHARLTPGRRPGVYRDASARAWRVSFNMPQLIAASIALVLVSGGGMWVALHQPTPVRYTAGPSRPDNERTVAYWTGRTDAAIADLQEDLQRNESRLDTATVRVVRENLALIDRAIGQARVALDADPGNAYLNLHLADTMRRKLELLRRINAIAAAQS
jgi:anti-sigma factor RsiW